MRHLGFGVTMNPHPRAAVEWFIEKTPCSHAEWLEHQMMAELLYGNVYQHSFTRPDGTLVVRALDAKRMMAAQRAESDTSSGLGEQ